MTALGHAQAAEAAEQLDGSPIRRIVASPYTRSLQTAAPIAAKLGVPIIVNAMVRERYAFVCDVGTPRAELVLAWPGYDFSDIDEVWWPAIEEPAASVIGRAARFRAEMAALADWRDTLVVSHWGFILALTGRSMVNGEWLRFDPNAPAPAEIVWRP